MKLLYLISFCLVFGWSVAGQIGGVPKPAVGIEEIALARDDGTGKPGEVTEKFKTTDTPIHFLIQLDSTDPVTVKMNLIAVKAVGLKPETKSVNVSFTTNGSQNQVYFDASPSGVWAAGNYRADVYLNDRLVKSRAFDIEQSTSEAAPLKPLPTRTFASRKKPRKN